MTTDPIADLLTRIRNANRARKDATDVPWSRMKQDLARVLVAEGFLRDQSTAEVEGRTIGADFLGTTLAPGRHWERAYATGAAATPYGFSPFAPGDDGVLTAPSGSALVYWDSGNPTPPNGNVPPWYLGQDPHSDPRKDDGALLAKLRFFETGQIVDVHGGEPNWTANCPRHPEQDPGC